MPDSVNEICTLRIELYDTDPLIWRELEVPTAITLKVLHDVVQAAMGWFDSHLWEFTISGQKFGVATSGPAWGGERRGDAVKTRLRDVLKARTTKIEYLYDFGDCWEHKLTLSAPRPGEDDVLYPRYVGGEWNAPPEDSGGIPGFYDKLDVIADPTHPDHDEIKEWLEDYDPRSIDEMQIKVSLARIARRRTAARGRVAKPNS